MKVIVAPLVVTAECTEVVFIPTEYIEEM